MGGGGYIIPPDVWIVKLKGKIHGVIGKKEDAQTYVDGVGAEIENVKRLKRYRGKTHTVFCPTCGTKCETTKEKHEQVWCVKDDCHCVWIEANRCSVCKKITRKFGRHRICENGHKVEIK